MTPFGVKLEGVQDLLGCFCRAGFGDRPGVLIESQKFAMGVSSTPGPIPWGNCLGRLGFSVNSLGINFPGHFLVSVQGDVVDPLTLQVLQRQRFAKFSAHSLSSDETPAPRLFGLRMKTT
ncbi:MAG: hypothetical protein CM15mP120_27870 [Pseudomonadota bacterium]|nr:MAG: hypothetical protein CM15mP120_27870 [Pseudomonadota bacterium]